MEHTYLIKPGKWSARGTFHDHEMGGVEAIGSSEITHNRDEWINKGTISLDRGEGIVMENEYRIRPIKGGEFCTEWTASNSSIGEMKGTFTLVDDSILSLFHSMEGHLRGSEFLVMVGSGIYRVRGTLYGPLGYLSSWYMDMEKKAD